MSTDIECINPIADVLKIGEYELYPDSLKLSGSSTVIEQATVTGGTVVTNRTVKSTLVTFTGRLVNSSDFMAFILYAESILKDKSVLDIVHNGFYFSESILKAYTAEMSQNIAGIKLVFMVSEVTENGG